MAFRLFPLLLSVRFCFVLEGFGTVCFYFILEDLGVVCDAPAVRLVRLLVYPAGLRLLNRVLTLCVVP